MTLIACNLSHKIPFLISDLIWSSTVEKKPFILPTNSFDITPLLPESRVYHPYTLGQKMYIVNDNVCVIFAGELLEIVEFLRELKMRCSYYDVLEQEHLAQFFNDYSFGTKYLNSACLLLHVKMQVNGAARFSFFYYPKEMHEVDTNLFNIKQGAWNSMKDETYEEVYAFGSGMRGYLNIINQQARFSSKFPKGDIIHAIQTNASLISKLLALERITIYTALQHWGGGFEFALFTGEKFEKIDKLAYLISEAQYDNEGTIDIPMPKLILYYKYINQDLYITMVEIRELEIKHIGNHTIFHAEANQFISETHIIPAIDQEVVASAIPNDDSFHTFRVAMGYSIVTAENEIYNPSGFNQGPGTQISYCRGKSIELIIDRRIIEEIRSLARTYRNS